MNVGCVGYCRKKSYNYVLLTRLTVNDITVGCVVWLD